ncbi:MULTISPECIES: hypothetical protein [unclassified Legionella]|uniref:hypothetical protein n=1 Tax=unclassified Legionella TaxID=2622702 RepID=UPI0013EFBE54|nr:MULTISPECIES: hypothetical protein [unclassified Legionella]MDI9817603.1 hypothetical protein [Legionella sp. PL877]
MKIFLAFKDSIYNFQGKPAVLITPGKDIMIDSCLIRHKKVSYLQAASGME